MIEVFSTNIQLESSSKKTLRFLKNEYPNLKFNIDLEDFNKPYPCGHSILRVEAKSVNTSSISQQLKSKGIECELLEEKICD